MAHQDVVPVPAVTVDNWKYPPWSGHYDGERIWGRGAIFNFPSWQLGATDCKNNLLGVLDALEFLLENNFQPKRTILAGFGFDEEIRYNISPLISLQWPQRGSSYLSTSPRSLWERQFRIRNRRGWKWNQRSVRCDICNARNCWESMTSTDHD